MVKVWTLHASSLDTQKQMFGTSPSRTKAHLLKHQNCIVLRFCDLLFTTIYFLLNNTFMCFRFKRTNVNLLFCFGKFIAENFWVRDSLAMKV